MDEIKLIAQERSDYGRKASRAFREEGLLPANIYGRGKENLTVTVNTKEFTRIFMAGHRIFTLEVGDGKEQSVVKEVQYDNLGSEVIHVDFTRIDITQKITLDVGVELIGTVASGMLQFPMKEVKVESLPAGFPASISINVIELKIGDVIRIEDLEVPDGSGCVGPAGRRAHRGGRGGSGRGGWRGGRWRGAGGDRQAPGGWGRGRRCRGLGRVKTENYRWPGKPGKEIRRIASQYRLRCRHAVRGPAGFPI